MSTPQKAHLLKAITHWPVPCRLFVSEKKLNTGPVLQVAEHLQLSFMLSFIVSTHMTEN